MENIFQSDFLNSIGDFIISNPVLGFFILGLIFVLRNETAILMSTVFVLQYHLTWPAVWITSIASVVILDNVLYWGGRIVKETRFSKLIERKLKFLPGFREYLKRHFKKIIMVVEYSIGLTLITMISSGWAGIKWKKFFFWHFLATTTWTAVMSTASYLFVSTLGYLKAFEILGRIEVGILIALAVFIIIELIIQKALKKASAREKFLRKIGETIKKTKNSFTNNNKEEKETKA